MVDYDAEILPHDYRIYCKDRNSRGGGVLIAVHNTIPSRIIASPSKLEIIAIYLYNLNCSLCVVYAPPSINMQPFLNVLSFLEVVVKSGSVMITGDFNRPDIN